MSNGELDPQVYAWTFRGPIADPGPDILSLLTKELVARIKVRQLEMQIRQVEAQVELLQMTKDALAKEYNIR